MCSVPGRGNMSRSVLAWRRIAPSICARYRDASLVLEGSLSIWSRYEPRGSALSTVQTARALGPDCPGLMALWPYDVGVAGMGMRGERSKVVWPRAGPDWRAPAW